LLSKTGVRNILRAFGYGRRAGVRKSSVGGAAAAKATLTSIGKFRLGTTVMQGR
jgi:hypothetical protein